MKTVIKHPQAPQSCPFRTRRGAQWRGCGNRTATLDRERNEACEVERRNSSVKRRGKNISQPLAFLDLGQSEVFTERSQPRWLCERATAEKTEGGRHNTAGM